MWSQGHGHYNDKCKWSFSRRAELYLALIWLWPCLNYYINCISFDFFLIALHTALPGTGRQCFRLPSCCFGKSSTDAIQRYCLARPSIDEQIARASDSNLLANWNLCLLRSYRRLIYGGYIASSNYLIKVFVHTLIWSTTLVEKKHY